MTGTRELIRLAGLYRGIPIHYVSTTPCSRVSAPWACAKSPRTRPWLMPIISCMGYVETKFVAEELLRNAGRAGLPVAIYRPLDIVGDQRTGAWNTATEMCALIRFITDTGVAPDIDLPLDFVPVDICAAAIGIHLFARRGGRMHLPSGQPASTRSSDPWLTGCAGTDSPSRPYLIGEWVDGLLRYAAQNPAHPMTPFVPLFVDRCQEPGSRWPRCTLSTFSLPTPGQRPEQALSGSGIAFPPVDEELLDLNIARLMATGYLRSPGTAGSSLARIENVK